MRFELLVAVRFLKDGRGQTVFILLGIAVGVAVQMFLGTLIAGLQRDLLETTVGRSAHIVFRGGAAPVGRPLETGLGTLALLEGSFTRRDDTLKDWREILERLDQERELTVVSPLAQGNGFVIRGDERWPVLLKGVELERASRIYKLSGGLVAGELQLEANRLLMGRELAREARLSPGDNVTLELPESGAHVFTVSGLFDLGNQVLNESWIFIDLRRTQRMLALGDEVNRIEAQVSDVFAADRLAAEIARRLSGVAVENWKDQNTELLNGLRAQSSSSLTIQAFVLLAVTLGIASVLAVSVVQKSKQIGILKAMGVRSASASRIFLFQGGVLGLIGSILGSGLGYGLTELFLWGTAQASGEPLFPLEFDVAHAGAIVTIATMVSILSAMLPARKSAGLNPIDVIRG